MLQQCFIISGTAILLPAYTYVYIYGIILIIVQEVRGFSDKNGSEVRVENALRCAISKEEALLCDGGDGSGFQRRKWMNGLGILTSFTYLV